MDNIQVITLSVLTLSVIYVLYLNYKKLNHIKTIEHRIKTLEKEFYTLDRKISEMPSVEHNELQADFNPTIARHSEMFRDILNSKNERINTEDLKQSDNSEQENLNKEELHSEDEDIDKRENKTQYEVLDDNCITDVLDNELKQEFNQYIMKTGEFESSDEEENLETFTNSNYENKDDTQDDVQDNLNQSVHLTTQDNIDTEEVNLDILQESILLNANTNETNEESYQTDINNENNLNTQLTELDENTETNETHLDGGINLDFESNVSKEQCIIDNILSESNTDVEIPNSLINNGSDSNNYDEETLGSLTVKQLKDIARDNNLVLKGNKKQIIARIVENK